MKFILAVVIVLQSFCIAEELSPHWQQRINEILSGTLNRYHYVDQSIDDNYSKRVFQLFLNKLDPTKTFFTEEQIIELTAYEYKIDNDIRNNTFYFYNLCLLRLKEQIEFSSSVYHTILKHDLNLNMANQIEADIDKKTYPKNNAELTKEWKANTQYQVAQNYITLYKEKYPSKNELVIEKDIEIEAKLKTKKDMDRRFKRLIEKKNKDYFTDYLDSITRAFGPHTSYLPPEEKEDFDINMSGKLEGIGAILREDDGVIKVVRIIPGSASWRQGELKAEDIILKVSQGNDDGISIIETPVREAVKLIRGPKGSTVKLTVKKPDGMIQTIPIKRDVVIIKSAYAKSGLFKVKNQQFGYINLPSFYRDFENNNGRNAADDIKQALLEFNALGSDGMILDLRNNGGGSLKDAVDISGFFIPSGPVVQVSDSYNKKNTYRDNDNTTIYNKPLVVLVNSFSASASEIVSAALQDYNRAIILGNGHTFGKGTVQKVVNLDNIIFRKNNPLGFIKITIQEYFRINGSSTQFQGVVPDIIYPSPYDYMDVGEKELKFAFKGTSTTPADYQKWNEPKNKSMVIKNSYERLKNNPAVATISDYNAFMKRQRDHSNKSIRIHDMWDNMQEIKQKNESLEKLTVNKIFNTYASIEPTIDSLTDDKEDFDKWVKTFDNDYLLNEALEVLSELHQSVAKNE